LPLWRYLRDNQLGEVFQVRYDVVLSDFDIVQPDIIFISNERRHLINEANFRGVPDLVIEILSPSKRAYDEVVKFKRYDALGVDEYWIVDPERDVVNIYRRTASGLALVPSTDPITTPVIPGFSVPVEKIFNYRI
jgi:Uma2 family endonuclease